MRRRKPSSSTCCSATRTPTTAAMLQHSPVDRGELIRDELCCDPGLLKKWGTDAQHERIAHRLDAVRGWLLTRQLPRTRRIAYFACSALGRGRRTCPADGHRNRGTDGFATPGRRLGPNSIRSKAMPAPPRRHWSRSMRRGIFCNERPDVPAWHRFPPPEPGGRRFVARSFSEQAVSDVFRDWVPARQGPVHLECRQRLGGNAAFGAFLRAARRTPGSIALKRRHIPSGRSLHVSVRHVFDRGKSAADFRSSVTNARRRTLSP